MNETQKNALKTLLTSAIEGWIEADETQAITAECSGWLGDEIARTMAEAGIAVLESNYRIQDYLRNNDLLNE